MPVQNFAETQRTAGSFHSDRKGPITEFLNRRYKREFVVWTNNVQDGPATIYGYPGLPTVGSSYQRGNDLDTLATCVDVDFEATESPFVWKLIASYDTARLVDPTITSPLNQPPEIVWGATTYERAMPRDLLAVPCVNSSSEAFDPPLMFEEVRPTVQISRNELTFNGANTAIFQNGVNLTAVAIDGLIAAPYCAKMTRLSGQKMIDIGFQYWKVSYEIEFRADTFCLFVLDQGYRDFNKKLFRDPIDFAPMANPTLLNGAGTRLTDAKSTLNGALNNSDTVVNIQAGDATKFPTGPAPGTAAWYFEIKIDNEIMQVIGGFGTAALTVTRGFAGTTPSAHANTAPVTMQPYYLRFFPAKVVDFTVLNLPTG